jgi:pyruvate kinase
MEHSRLFDRRTKIICTIGPATASPAVLERLIRTGMNIARFNLSHGTYPEHANYIRTIRSISERLGIRTGILIDLPGPKYRIGPLKGGKATLKKGNQILLTTRPLQGDATILPVNFPNLPHDVKVGDTVLLDDGAMQLKVLGIVAPDIDCRITVGGELIEGRGLVVPGMHPSIPFITESLKEHIRFAIQEQPDYLALSFVGSAEDVISVRDLLAENGSDAPLISKIERGQAVARFDSILAASDAIMVARGDLGVDIPLERIPLVQKEVIRKCNRAGKPVITATEMLESMVNSVRPTRAETTDVANAIFDGSDAIMLSAETSIGKYPVQSVAMMARIARETEGKLPYESMLSERADWLTLETSELISYNACYTAQTLGAAAIIAYTRSGSTAGRVSKYRPRVPVLALTPSHTVSGRLLLRWGIHPLTVAVPSSVDELFTTTARLVKDVGLANSGDLIVITCGLPLGEAGSTNLLKVQKID